MPFRTLSYPLLLFWDKFQRSLVLAFRSLWLHKLRAFLSVLGIIIGTAAVIALMAFGEGSMRDALEDIERQGATNIIVRSVKPGDAATSQRRSFIASYGLNQADYDAMLIIDSVLQSVPMRILEPQEIRRLHRMVNGRVVATTQDYQVVSKFEIALGRFLVDGDGQDDAAQEEGDTFEARGDNVDMRNVVVLGSEVARSLFPFENPLGQTIVLNKMDYVVVGVLADRVGITGGGTQVTENFNRDVYVPLRTVRGRYGQKVYIRQSGSRSGEQVEFHQITLTVSEMSKVRDVGRAVSDLLSRRHYKQDWAVLIPLDRLELAEQARDRYKTLLFLIASISLLVGGIGIMNIMLATVTERTREIGIRRALGAKRRDITLQFLIEAVVQTSIGGILGLLLGLSIVFLVPWLGEKFFQENLPAKLHVPSIFLSLIVAVSVGVLFGWYPARRASRLDPIEALRHE